MRMDMEGRFWEPDLRIQAEVLLANTILPQFQRVFAYKVMQDLDHQRYHVRTSTVSSPGLTSQLAHTGALTKDDS